MTKNARFIPALKFDWLTRFFDPVMKLTMSEKKFKEALLLQADIKDNETILDFGCGTATLTIMAKKEAPKATIYGADVDPNVLKIAKNKVENSGYEISLRAYDGISLPYKGETFDKVLSSLVFHHLTRSQKEIVLKEIYRILKFGGELHIADFGRARNIFMRGMFLIIQIFDGFINTSDNIKGLLPEIIREAGFDKVIEHKRIMTMFGTISLYRAIKLL